MSYSTDLRVRAGAKKLEPSDYVVMPLATDPGDVHEFFSSAILDCILTEWIEEHGDASVSLVGEPFSKKGLLKIFR